MKTRFTEDDWNISRSKINWNISKNHWRLEYWFIKIIDFLYEIYFFFIVFSVVFSILILKFHVKYINYWKFCKNSKSFEKFWKILKNIETFSINFIFNILYFTIYKKIYFMFLSLQKYLLKTTYWYYTEDEKLLKINEISVRFTEKTT